MRTSLEQQLLEIAALIKKHLLVREEFYHNLICDEKHQKWFSQMLTYLNAQKSLLKKQYNQRLKRLK